MPLSEEFKEKLAEIRSGSSEVSFFGFKCGDEGAEVIAAILKSNRTLTTLHLGKNQITGTGAAHLAAALRENRTLAKLYLWKNQITDTGAAHLAEALKENRTLTELSLTFNQITDTGAAHLAAALRENRTLTELNLRNDQITDTGARYLAEALRENHTLTELDLRRNQITDTGAAHLAAALRANRTLTALILDGNQITDTGIAHLAVALRENRTLTILDLGDNPITDAGAAHLAEALKANRTLAKLYLWKNQITDIGAAHLAEALKENRTLTALYLCQSIAQPQLDTIDELLKANEERAKSAAGNQQSQGGRAFSGFSGRREQSTTSTTQTQSKGWKFDPPSSTFAQPKGWSFTSTSSETSLALSSSELPRTDDIRVDQSPPVPKRRQAPPRAVTVSPSSLAIAFTELELGERIGAGGFGDVFRGIWQMSVVAIKQLRLQELTPKAKAEFQNEVAIMQRLRQPHVVQLFGACLQPFLMVMEFMSGGSLYQRLHDERPLSWPSRYQMGSDVAAGLGFLHAKNILHRDLKSLNVLLNESGRAKITDFGLSQVKTESRSVSTAKSMVGSLLWMAPELFKRRAKHTKKSDVYALGILLWELAARALPFSDAQGNQALVMEWVKDGEREKIPADTPAVFQQVITRCWEQDANSRPPAAEAQQLLLSASSNSSGGGEGASSPPPPSEPIRSRGARITTTSTQRAQISSRAHNFNSETDRISSVVSDDDKGSFVSGGGSGGGSFSFGASR